MGKAFSEAFRTESEMQLLVDDIQRNGRRGDTSLPARPAVITPDMEPAIREAVQGRRCNRYVGRELRAASSVPIERSAGGA